MKIKKLFSLFMVIAVALTSSRSCYANDYVAISDTDVPSATSKLPKRNWHKLVEESRQIDSGADDLQSVRAVTQGEEERLNGRLSDLERECENLEAQMDIVDKELEKWEDDVLCKNCISCKMADKAIALQRGYKLPSNVIFRSKRFYKGVIIGAVITVAVLTGAYVYVHFLKNISHESSSND